MSRQVSPEAAHTAITDAVAKARKPPRVVPTELPWEQIKVSPTVFQRRGPVLNYSRQAFIEELSRDIKRKGSAAHLEPVTVWWAGAWFLVDGHHRMAAVVKTLGRAAVVPVAVLAGDLEAALAATVALNRKTKLTMSAGERMDAAWFLTKRAPGMSKAQVMEAAGASHGLVAKQRKVWRELQDRHASADAIDGPRNPLGLNWREAMAAAEGKRLPTWDHVEGKRAAVESITRTLTAALGKQIRTNPEAFLEALRGLWPDNAPGLSSGDSGGDPEDEPEGESEGSAAAWLYAGFAKLGEAVQAGEALAKASRKALLAAARVVGVDGAEAAELVKAASGHPQAAIDAAKALAERAPTAA